MLQVSESSYYAWRGCASVAWAARHAWLTDFIRQVYAEFAWDPWRRRSGTTRWPS
ncbi:unnamed protein product [[Actinomadura] parvosata subsp. kistnae]|nr:unnamed protein product [Actinomadura parvosata subsp. kistnae]